MYKTNDEIREDYGNDIILFEDPSFASAFIGISSDSRAVYDYDLMVQFLHFEENCTPDEARDAIDYQTINSLGFEGSPIVLYAQKF